MIFGASTEQIIAQREFSEYYTRIIIDFAGILSISALLLIASIFFFNIITESAIQAAGAEDE